MPLFSSIRLGCWVSWFHLSQLHAKSFGGKSREDKCAMSYAQSSKTCGFLKSLSINPSVDPSNHLSIHPSICPPTHSPIYHLSIHPFNHPLILWHFNYSFIDLVSNTEHVEYRQTHNTLSSMGARTISFCWHCIWPQCLTNHQCQMINCQMNEKGNYITCLIRKQCGEWFCFSLVLFPNFLAVVHISVLNKCLLKEGRSLCAAAVVCVHESWPYACVPCP